MHLPGFVPLDIFSLGSDLPCGVEFHELRSQHFVQLSNIALYLRFAALAFQFLNFLFLLR